MAQALEKGNISPKLRKMGFFAQKNVIYSQNSVFDEIQFSEKSLINRKKQPQILPQQVLVQQIPIKFCCYYKPPRSGPHEVRNCPEAAVPEKDTKILKEGARGDRGSPDQNESPISDLSNALQFVPLVHVVSKILVIENFLSIFLKISKNAQVNWG